ncbi:hypothetical protein Agub_g12126 [Astrephomene gubernaculifera]|uniref:RING-type domain-containing protein n=1 Tax=Astrephomene gubernaculifera TaxID=47775 RepID=A0AAD3HR19_9CHLO|nr:hypothetical protein Agub_g12126 [Astrephomene gubernaculifera]
MRQRASRVSLAVLAYFLSSTASLAWVLHKAVPAGWEQRGFHTYVQFAANFWENVLPGEVALFAFLNFYLSSLAMVALATAALFLGRLSAAESQRMSHRLVKYTVFKTVFLGCVITNDPRDVALWLAWFALVGYLRVFLGAAKDRLEGLLTAPGARVGRHVRAVGLLLLLGLQDGLALMVALRLLWPPPAASSPSLPASPSPPSPPGGSSRVLLCVFDCAVVAVEAGKTLLRYVVHMGDRLGWTPPAYNTNNTPGGAGGSGNMYDGTGAGGLLRRLLLPPGVGCFRLLLRLLPPPGSLLYHVELVADVAVHLLTLAHYLHVWVLHGLSFHLIDAMLFLDMRSVLSSLLRRLRTHLAYRAATHRLDTCFKDVYPHQQHQQLAATGGGTDAAAAAAATAAHSSSFDCTICMEEIGSVGKQLPCGHIFHLACLRAWLQQAGSESFTCPNCRTPLLVQQQQQQGEGQEEEEGAEGGGGARLRRRGGRGGGGGGLLAGWRWWLGGLVERAYVRVVVALEPLLLSLLVLILDRVVGLAPTGRPAPPRPHQQQQQPRRHPHPHAHPHAAATSLEGFGESPGPLPPPRAPHPPINPGASGAATRLIRRGTGQSAGRSGGGGGGDTLGVANRWQEAREEGYPSSDCFEDDSDDGDWYGDKDGDGDVSDDGGEGDDGGRGGGGASHDSRSREGAAAAVQQQRRREGAAAAGVQEEEDEMRHGRRGRSAARLWGCSSGGPGHRPMGHFDPHYHRGTAAAAAAGAPGPSSAAWQAAAEDEGEEGGMYGGRRSRQGRQQRSGDPSLRGPRGQRGLLPPLPPAAAEVPTFSGDVLPRGAAAAVRRLGRTLSTSLRSSWGAGGVCAGAVGGGEDSEGGDEVSSRPRHAHPRSSQPHNRRHHPQHRNQLLQPQQQQQRHQEEEQEEE